MYVALKVAMILSVEAGFFPLMCGWWMDICSFVSTMAPTGHMCRQSAHLCTIVVCSSSDCAVCSGPVHLDPTLNDCCSLLC